MRGESPSESMPPALSRPSTENRQLSKVRLIWEAEIFRAAQKYLVAGGACALVDWGLFALCFYVLEMHYFLSGAISFIVATAMNYFVSVRFVFGAGRRSARHAVVLTYFVSMIRIALNLSILTIGVDVLTLEPIVAKIAASGIVVGWNFLMRYFYVFRK